MTTFRDLSAFLAASLLAACVFLGLLALGVEARCHHTPSLCETTQDGRP